MASIRSSGLVIAAGTYDGVLAGWELMEKKKDGLKLAFATAVHTGSIRSLCIATSAKEAEPGSLLSCGYDETLRTHDWHKRLTSSGEVRTPTDFGTPVCSAFAPCAMQSTHCIIGFSTGKITIYKKRDWSVQHVLAGHEGGVGSISVHPSGKLALSGGTSDGKLKLWDLTKGRLAFVHKINPTTTIGGKSRYEPVSSLIWSKDGDFYALSYGGHVTVREVASGKDVLDVDLPSRVNQIALMAGQEGLFVAAACNDGSLPVLAVDDSDDENRRAIMAIEPVASHLAREERFKCITCVRNYYVVTANSAGVVSLMNLEGAIKMIMTGDGNEEGSHEDDENDTEDEEADDSNDEDDSLDLAVEIVETTQLGTGARITCLTAWCKDEKVQVSEEENTEKSKDANEEAEVVLDSNEEQRKRKAIDSSVSMDEVAVKKARSLVEKAKALQQKKDKKKKRKAKKV